MPLVEAVALTRAFGVRRAVDKVDLAIESGECLALFGPNGAGKTTLLRLFAGLLRPTSGEARVGGVTLPGGARARATVGLISHQTMLYPALTALENLLFAARLHGVPDARDAALAALERVSMADRAETLVRDLSRGMQQRVTVARALVHRPRVLLLDEPFTGLDDAGSTTLAATLTELAEEGAALLLVTHDVREGLALATQVAVMRRGAIVLREPRLASGEPDGFVQRYRALVAS
ncbi:MAG: heme ABC exporter ATP-binding protein CcmA [Gemmatimonadaceae bacterium]|nr:heme ABC exporter ATP-binding protein CcmA [Gemmatimonadaceae bacterium]